MKPKHIFLVLILCIAGGVYLYTMAPTVSFWDCGEFIAVAYALGVPHPPGTPFFAIFGRVWLLLFKILSSILPISKEVAWHMNLSAVTSSLISLAFIYNIVLRLLKRWRQDENSTIPYVGAFAACLTIAFTYTFWDNSLETEMYAPATAIALFLTWLALRWHESHEQKVNRNRLILFIFYLVFLTSGIHLTAFLVIVPLYIFILYAEKRFKRDIYFWLAGIFVVLGFFAAYISSDSFFKPSLVLLALICVSAFIVQITYGDRYKNAVFFWITVLVALIGFSPQLYLMVRADVLTKQYKAGDVSAPKINECDPRTYQAFYDVLHRKQYEPMSVLPRRTQLEMNISSAQGYIEQIKTYLRYFSWQFVSEQFHQLPRVLLLLIFYFFGLWGIYEHFKKDKKTFLLIFILFFMTSFAMMTYLNLKFSPSDPNPAHNPREVRERDYFFHPGFAFFAIFLGIGFVTFLDWIKSYFRKINHAQNIGMGLIVLLAIVPFATHIHDKNRYGNWIPRDYGYNMLACCEDNSVVFTNGDNDTFPLWFIQEVLGYKRSVIIANLSLINTDWYIKQLKYWGAPITFSDRIISRLMPFRTPDGKIMLVKDIMVRHILANNAGKEIDDVDYIIDQGQFAHKFLRNQKGKMTIYFATTVSNDNLEGFQPYLRLEGLVYRVVPDSSIQVTPIGIETDVEQTEDLFYRKMKYTGIFNPEDYPALDQIIPDFERRRKDGEFIDYKVYKDENTRRLLVNYAAGLFALGFEYQNLNRTSDTKKTWQWALLFRPEGNFSFLYNLSVLYFFTGNYDSALLYLTQIEDLGMKDAGVYFRMAACYQAMGNNIKAEEYLRKTIQVQPRFREAYELLVGLYVTTGQIEKAAGVLRDWLKMAPADTSARRMLDDLSRGMIPEQ